MKFSREGFIQKSLKEGSVSKTKKAVIIFSGFNQRAVVAFLRTLEHLDVPYVIIALSQKDPIFTTHYNKRVVATRGNHSLDIDDIRSTLVAAKKKVVAEKYLIAPSTEALNRFLLENRQLFEGLNCEIPLVDEDLYVKVSDKKPFGELCQSYDIPIPNEYSDPQHLKFPCVAKPRTYISSDGTSYKPEFLRTQTEYNRFLESHTLSDFYFQEFISGDSYYLLYYFYKDGRVVKLSQQNYAQQPGGKAIIAAELSEIHSDKQLDVYEDMLKNLGYFGLLMIEIRRQGDRYYTIEANPRFWGPSQLFVDGGCNLFEDFLLDNKVLAEKSPQKYERQARYFWHAGRAADENNVVYHSVDKDGFDRDISKWLEVDIYNREDTQRVYKSELEGVL